MRVNRVAKHYILESVSEVPFEKLMTLDPIVVEVLKAAGLSLIPTKTLEALCESGHVDKTQLPWDVTGHRLIFRKSNGKLRPQLCCITCNRLLPR